MYKCADEENVLLVSWSFS